MRALSVILACLVLLNAPAIWAEETERADAPYLVVLGVAQDGGFPQAGCRKECCRAAWQDEQRQRYVSCLAIVDPRHQQRWLFDATPDFPRQLRMLDELAPTDSTPGLDGIFLSHAHIGHYSGLIHLGREVLGAEAVAVYAMPRMRHFLTSNGPWNQLVKLRQVKLERLAAGGRVALNDRIAVVPFLVPHRDEYSETVGFRIQGPSRTVIFLPDIDKWNRWNVAIEDILAEADIAYLDGTFFTDAELPDRNMAEIPHPFVLESIKRFEVLSKETRNRIRFIHLNHTNPLLNPASHAVNTVQAAGHHVAQQGERFQL